jgi:hypothetical protein
MEEVHHNPPEVSILNAGGMGQMGQIPTAHWTRVDVRDGLTTHFANCHGVLHFSRKVWEQLQETQASGHDRFAAAVRRFDLENSADPHKELVDGVEQPRELVYARWLTDWVMRLCPEPSEALRLAARCQHLCRWRVPRDSYPMTRAGYLAWREALKKFHAQRAGEILRKIGYPEEVVIRVQSLNLKKDFPKDPESRVLEDALCLLFLERQFDDLAKKTGEEKMVNALQKAWRKMTPAAHALALNLPYGPHEKALIEKALNSTTP